MSDTHLVSALRRKRAEIGGHIRDLERKIKRQGAAMAHVDATIRLFSLGTNPDAIPPKRTYRRTRYFSRHELSRLVMDALRLATGPLVAARVLGVLRGIAKRGEVVRAGTSRNAQWAVAAAFL